MADNLRKFTTQEVLNKVYSDSSGNSIGINAATSKETLNAALDTSNSRLNVSLAGGTIGGDVTITGDLTVNGDGAGAYDEIISGGLVINVTDGQNVKGLHITQLDAGEWTSMMEAVSYGLLIRSTANDTTPAFKVQGNGTSNEVLSALSNGNVGIGTASPDYQLELEKAGGGFLSFKTTDTELVNNDVLGTIQFGADDATASGIDIGAKIVATATDNFQSASSNVDAPTKLQFFTQDNTTNDVMSTVGATLTLGGDDQSATFAGDIEVLKGSPLIRVKDSTNSVRGFMSVSSGVVKMGGSDNNNVEIQSNGTTRLTIAGSGNSTFAGSVNIADDTTISSAEAGGLVLTIQQSNEDDNSSELKFVKDSASPATGDKLGQITFYGDDDGGTQHNFADIAVLPTGLGASSGEQGTIRFRALNGGAMKTPLTLVGENATFGGTIASSPSITDGIGLNIEADSLTTGNIGRFYSDSDSNATRNLVEITNDHIGSSGTTPLRIRQDAPHTAIDIDSANTGDWAVDIQGTAHTTAGLLYAYSNSPSNSTRDLVHIHNDHPDADNTTALKIIQDGALEALNINMNGTAINLTTPSTGQNTWINFTDGTTKKWELSKDTLNRFNIYSYASSQSIVQFPAAGTSMIVNGDVGMGVTPETSHSSVTTLQVGGLSAISATTAQSAGSSTWLGNNVYINSSGSQAHIVTDEASVYRQVGGTHNFQTVASGSADASISFTTNMVIDINSRISLSNNDSGGTGGSDSTSGNTLLGWKAGNDIASGGLNNTSIGHASGFKLTTGDNNTYLGRYAGLGNLTGSGNTFIGSQSGLSDNGNSHSDNTGVGASTLYSLTTGVNNVAIGKDAGLSLNSGEANSIIGKSAGDALTTGILNTALGYFALSTSTNVDKVVAIGAGAMESGDATSGADGTVAIGNEALKALTSGGKNTAIGYQAGLESTIEDFNTYIGYQSGYRTAGLDNQHNTFVGYNAGSGDWTSTLSSKNTAVGSNTMAGAMNSGLQNSALGYAALNAVTTGNNNIGIGVTAGDVITTGGSNTIIGSESDPSVNSATNQTVVGYGAIGVADNSVTLGNADVTDVYMSTTAAPAAVHCAKVVTERIENSTNKFYELNGSKAVSNGVTTDLLYVDHSNNYSITLWCFSANANQGQYWGHMQTVYGGSTVTETLQKINGSLTNITVTYQNSNRALRVKVDGVDATVYYHISGMGNSQPYEL